MRFPLSLSLKLVKYLRRQAKARRKRFPIVLMLEPSHRCNLRCKGCGRISEYKDVAQLELTRGECLASAEECPAPIVTVTGGEPLLHPEIDTIISDLLGMGRHVILCTNALLLRRWLPKFEPRSEFQINVHMDGLAATHDEVTGRPGTFSEAKEAITEAKKRGFRVCTNTTVYKFTPMSEIVELLKLLKKLRIDGILLSPAFNFSSNGSEIFMTKGEIRERFSEIVPLVGKYPVMNTPIFMDFLLGAVDLPCTPWGNPTRNVKGWKSPCYMITNCHYETFEELMERTDWPHYENKEDPRCANCMTHCGFEPTVALRAQRSIKDGVRMLLWNLFR